MKTYLGLCLLIVLFINFGSTELSSRNNVLREKKVQNYGLLKTTSDEFLEPATVPDPQDGGRWWYAPSPRAEMFSHKYRHLIRAEQHLKANEELRLPGDLIPIVYNIRLLPFIEEGNFTTDGHIDIFVDCAKNTSSILINSAEIDIDSLSITVQHVASNSILEVEQFIDDQLRREMIEIQTKTALLEGNRYKISMDFTSYLNDQMRGFYRSSYMENGVRKWLAVTQMESTDARRAFPCFDEPNVKAEFSVALGRKKTMSTASNMLLLSTYPMEGQPDYVWDQYQTTVKMSSYLVAFLVSEFAAVPAAPGHRVPFRLFVKPESQSLAQYSLTVGPAMQEFYEDYFKIPYPLPKQDLAAIPDFSAGAMENWGLITYRETRLLIDLEKDTRSLRQSIASINAHEIAHQWFGNLVTTDWWNTIWLNEGFATYVEFLGTEAVEPGLRYMDQFVNTELHYVFGIDALETSRPINLNVTTPSEIDRMFDGISYDKGACIIRMCANFIGLDTFNRGLTRYLNARAYKNAVQDDLWQALQEQADEEGVELPATVKEIMDTWTLQMGFPLITVTRNYNDWSATVSQSRFLIRKDPDSSDDHVYRWWVPLTFHSPSNTTEKFQWMADGQDTITIQNIEALPNEWVIFNVDQKNVYRVAYDQLNYQLLAKQLLTDHSFILDNNRAQLLDDAFVLASVDVIPYNFALSLSAYLKNEVEWAPWNAVLGELNYIDNMLYNSAYHVDWQNYLIGLVTPYYNSVGFEESPSDAHLTVYSRSDAINWACRLRISDCVMNVKAKYAAYMSDPSNDSILSPNQKSLILNYGVELGGTNEWNFAFGQYVNGDGAFLVPMTKTRQVSLLYQQLEWMLNGTIHNADVKTLFNNIAANPVGNRIATNFLVNRWADIEAAFGNDYFADFFRYLCDRKNTQEELDQLLKLRDDHSDVLGSSNTVKQGIEVVQTNIEWIIYNPGEIALWLGVIDQAPTAPPTTVTPATTTTTIRTTTLSNTTPPRTSSTTTSGNSAPEISFGILGAVLFTRVIAALIC